MRKSTTFIALAALCLAILVALLAAAIVTGPQADDHTGNISKALTGMNLTYYSFAGKPMNYTIARDDIQSVDSTGFDGRPAWKVRVGQGMQWEIIMDRSGNRILDIKQLFVT